jgi:hypothetical protein
MEEPQPKRNEFPANEISNFSIIKHKRRALQDHTSGPFVGRKSQRLPRSNIDSNDKHEIRLLDEKNLSIEPQAPVITTTDGGASDQNETEKSQIRNETFAAFH